MSTETATGCCPKFDPLPWSDREFYWDKKKFVTDRVRTLMHIPLNFGSVIKRNMEMICGGQPPSSDPIVLAKENSPWSTQIYISVDDDIPQAQMTTLSGTFISRVFEGPYSQTKNWCKQMQEHVASGDRKLRQMYYFFTTCPKCAKKYGKNYVVMLAQVEG